MFVGVAVTLYFNHYNEKTDYVGKGTTESAVSTAKDLVNKVWPEQPKKDK